MIEEWTRTEDVFICGFICFCLHNAVWWPVEDAVWLAWGFGGQSSEVCYWCWSSHEARLRWTAGKLNQFNLALCLLLPSLLWLGPCAGSGVERKDPLSFLAGCCKMRLNWALSVLSLNLGFLGVSAMLLTMATSALCYSVSFVCSVPWLFLLGCQYQCKWLTGKTPLQKDL